MGKQQLAQGKSRGTHRDPCISNNMDFPGALREAGYSQNTGSLVFLQVTVKDVATFLPLLPSPFTTGKGRAKPQALELSQSSVQAEGEVE